MAIAAYNSQFLITAQPSIALTDEATATTDNINYTISNSAKRYIDINTAVVVQAKYDEVQTVTITGAPTGGTFTLTFGANTTSGIAYNAAASTVQTALTGLVSIGGGNATVTGANGGPWTVEFTGSLGYASQALITKNAAGLTGGTSPNVAIAEAQAGSGFVTVSSSLYSLQYAGGVVVFINPTVGTAVVRFHSGAYYAYSTLGGAHTAEFAPKLNAIDVTAFNSGGVEAYLPGLMGGTLKCSEWWANETRMTSLMARDLLVVSFVLPSSNRYEGYVYATDIDLKGDPKSALDESISFQLTNQFFGY